jgi:hypothetical protein
MASAENNQRRMSKRLGGNIAAKENVEMKKAAAK